ncbi:FAD binding domain protein [Aspergillus sclerotialis]|uniref:FAD binding domain protein n=1 Tax=Aspergillus sclerotialis TaxID=2070753 RepID=A0A3A2ZN40_9EURO|nr:FAD binding domain protein [Aspergillus sclerotialis]
MASIDEHKLSILTEFLAHHPHISYATPSSPDYERLRCCFIINNAIKPPLIVCPVTATDVSYLVSVMKTHSIPFTIRSGGHDLFLRSLATHAVTIDLRDIAHVQIDHESQSARIGGGVLIGGLATQLANAKLATAFGTIPTVGYVGWAIHGGYGMLSAHYGLGVDQILGARVVNANGDLVDADDSMLKGIRGGGGILGVIVELTIRVYPLEKVFAGVVMYDSHDLPSTIKQYNDGYRSLAENGLPPQLGIQQAVVNSPTGKTLIAFFLWSSSDIQTGELWLSKFSSIAQVSMHTVTETTLPDWMNMAGRYAVERRYGSMATITLRRLTPRVVDVISTYALTMPSDPTSFVSIHQLRGPATEGKHPDSIFPTRQPHYMFEIFPALKSPDNLAAAAKWADEFEQALRQAEPENVVPGTYLALSDPSKMNSRRIFADKYETLVELKKTYDPQNIFQFAIAQV